MEEATVSISEDEIEAIHRISSEQYNQRYDSELVDSIQNYLW